MDKFLSEDAEIQLPPGSSAIVISEAGVTFHMPRVEGPVPVTYIVGAALVAYLAEHELEIMTWWQQKQEQIHRDNQN